MRKSVVLPDPDDPSRTVVFLDGMTSEKLSTATVPSAKILVIEWNSIIVAENDVYANRDAECSAPRQTCGPVHHVIGQSRSTIGQRSLEQTFVESWINPRNREPGNAVTAKYGSCPGRAQPRVRDPEAVVFLRRKHHLRCVRALCG
jgi:hypothetical protein